MESLFISIIYCAFITRRKNVPKCGIDFYHKPYFVRTDRKYSLSSSKKVWKCSPFYCMQNVHHGRAVYHTEWELYMNGSVGNIALHCQSDKQPLSQFHRLMGTSAGGESNKT